MKQADLLKKGISLRKQGYSYNEISQLLGISKSTASLRFRDVKVTIKGQNRIIKLGNDGRLKSARISIEKRNIRWQKVADKTINFKEDLAGYTIGQCKTLLAMLYWGEGAKTTKRLDFINSDPNLIKTYLFLLRKCFKINEVKLRPTIHLHEYHNQSEVIGYWSKITKIDKSSFHIYKKSHTAKRKKPGYQGCLSLRYNDVNIFDEVMLIIDRFQKAIK